MVAAGVEASSDECSEALSGFAMRNPPRDWERLISPSMVGATIQTLYKVNLTGQLRG